LIIYRSSIYTYARPDKIEKLHDFLSEHEEYLSDDFGDIDLEYSDIPDDFGHVVNAPVLQLNFPGTHDEFYF